MSEYVVPLDSGQVGPAGVEDVAAVDDDVEDRIDETDRDVAVALEEGIEELAGEDNMAMLLEDAIDDEDRVEVQELELLASETGPATLTPASVLPSYVNVPV